MKRTEYILGFAVLALALGHVGITTFAAWYTPWHIHGDADENRLLEVLLITWVCSLIVGGFFGNWFFRRNRTMKHTAFIVTGSLALILALTLMPAPAPMPATAELVDPTMTPAQIAAQATVMAALPEFTEALEEARRKYPPQEFEQEYVRVFTSPEKECAPLPKGVKPRILAEAVRRYLAYCAAVDKLDKLDKLNKPD